MNKLISAMSDDGSDPYGFSCDQLRTIVERIERLEEERKALAEDVKQVYSEAEGGGFDKKTIRRLVALRRKDPDEIDEEEALLELYRSAVES